MRQATHKGVLLYLRIMERRSQLAHRHDLETLYREAWETAAGAVYGPLSPRPPLKAIATYPAPARPARRPLWRARMLEKPYRKITNRFDQYEMLECGHLVWTPWPEDPPAKRRRCGECAKTSERSAEAIPAPASFSKPVEGRFPN